ncbi:unnamed protein product [Lactuca saligna]|uniref:Uncharacterized protein n=1 Tax=Lactuca saligna TaxID=75948 RepID=A0AA35Y837_LACSI|nr:unnamed protein product [Lactuca saligna]
MFFGRCFNRSPSPPLWPSTTLIPPTIPMSLQTISDCLSCPPFHAITIVGRYQLKVITTTTRWWPPPLTTTTQGGLIGLQSNLIALFGRCCLIWFHYSKYEIKGSWLIFGIGLVVGVGCFLLSR